MSAGAPWEGPLADNWHDERSERAPADGSRDSLNSSSVAPLRSKNPP
jgi:hypothetical protein